MIKYIKNKNKADAISKAPWANKLVKVDDGYVAFQTNAEYLNWKKTNKWTKQTSTSSQS